MRTFGTFLLKSIVVNYSMEHWGLTLRCVLLPSRKATGVCAASWWATCSAGWSAAAILSPVPRGVPPLSVRPQHQSRSRGPRTRRQGRDRARPPRYRAVGRRRPRFRSCRTPVDARQPSPLPCASTPPPLRPPLLRPRQQLPLVGL